jgi:ribosomal protein S18 acetylase RimI-like enzyme
MQNRDAARVADLHHAAMGASLWAKLGIPFLAELYRGLIDSPHFLGFVFEEAGQDPGDTGVVRGFIAGSTDASRMMKEVFRSRFMVLGAAAIPGVLKRPAVLKHLALTARYFSVSDDDDLAVTAESLFCSFEPQLRGRRISGHVNKYLFDDLLARGHRYVKVTTETDNTGANRQLQSWGFEDRGRFRFYGKEMVRYVLDLQASDRVDPVSRHPAV